MCWALAILRWLFDPIEDVELPMEDTFDEPVLPKRVSPPWRDDVDEDV